MTTTVREQLHQQIDRLPDEIVQLVAEFASFVMARRQITPIYTDWHQNEWQTLTLEQFFREEDELVYTLKDAQEIYHP